MIFASWTSPEPESVAADHHVIRSYRKFLDNEPMTKSKNGQKSLNISQDSRLINCFVVSFRELALKHEQNGLTYSQIFEPIAVFEMQDESPEK
ncbi:hypothetical protein BpHYR1_027351 [Brachionus plicatilis]|uniref:Uncharacterized protein n=1 Tax=Brachionus plicatilis TaxID=10195 RepID=A0A3M7PXJ6_BRAPC|nr:hypothetical protein BpHYR1_027351 [Brachionus plicatilis]